eukprot:333406_1
MELSLFSLIFGNIGCLIATIILFLCGFHSMYIYYKNRFKLHEFQMRAMTMEFIMIILFLCSTLSYITLRNTLFRPYHSDHPNHLFECRIAMFLALPPYVLGKSLFYVMLMHRVYMLFHNSPLQINKKVPYLLTSLLIFTVIPMTLLNAINVFNQNNNVYNKQYSLNGYHIELCQLEFDTKQIGAKLLVLYLPILNILIELFIAVYIIYSFMSRLTALRTLSQNSASIQLGTRDKMRTKSVSIDSTHTSTHEETTVEIVINNFEQEQMQELKVLTKKQTCLGVTALIASILFYVYGMATITPDFIGWNIFINVLSIHLMFGYSKFIWNRLRGKKRELKKIVIS